MINIHKYDFNILNKKGLLNKLLFCILFLFHSLLFANSNQVIRNFLETTFINNIPQSQRIWIDKEKQSEIKILFNPSQTKLSYRYWQQGKQTVWIMEELGKEQNITTGIVIENNAIKTVEVLIYRESRGRQVQNQRFTRQYNQKNYQSNLIKEIDSISGATLSVNALNKQVKLALWLNTIIQTKQGK